MEKIYGVYDGGIDMSKLNKVHEIDVWKKIEAIGGVIFWANHEAADHRTTLSKEEIKKLNELQYSLEYLVYYTRNFGVTFSREPQAGDHVERSEDYNKWYCFWDNVVKSWSNAQLNEFIQRREKKQDFSDLLPKTNWKGEIITNSINI